MKKALVTGIGGFVGGHLTAYLISQKIKVEGLVHPKHGIANRSTKDARIIECDLLNKKEVLAKLENTDYDYIFHLAAYSSPAESFKNPQETLRNNIFGQLNLLE